MTEIIESIINKLAKSHSLELSEYRELIDARNSEIAEKLASMAVAKRIEIYGKKVFIRGLIEVSNICKNDCLYCGIRASNKNCQR